MNITVLCYNKHNELVMATAGEDIEIGDVVHINGDGQLYSVTNTSESMTMNNHTSKVIYLEKYKQIRKKAG